MNKQMSRIGAQAIIIITKIITKIIVIMTITITISSSNVQQHVLIWMPKPQYNVLLMTLT